ncbi:ATPase AAA [Tamlana sedimentorum]|uniref:ATPase AAA n=1 Tax=Neotamlana sedimentorum TaxID=1435349 RepID=A0A0D7WBE9_9FLAO|nr:ATP-binding protein [Tamlana sedimentorum]KJD36441.1 ATPase AAA [Tamlana sedimentorum]
MADNFNIIRALCRTALTNPSDALIHQVERLIKNLEKEGKKKEAKSLSALLASGKKDVHMSPSRIEKSFLHNRGESLTNNTVIPVDKETATPLAEVFFAEDLPTEMPVFDIKMEEVIISIINEWMKYDRLLEIDASPANSCLIYGVPGTGKTHLAKWISKEINIPIVLAKLDGLMSSFLGTTSRNIGNLFKFANRYNCVLLLDEFDAIAKLRNDPHEVGEVKRVVNTLLQNLDSRRGIGFTIGVTNHEGLLDPAIWRRFDVQIEIPRPTQKVMMELLKEFLKPIDLADSEMKFLTWCIEGASGADAKVLANWIKKSSILSDKTPMVDTMRKFALLNTGRVKDDKRNLFIGNDENLISTLIKDENYAFKQKDIASLFGMTQSSLSKLLSKQKEVENI